MNFIFNYLSSFFSCWFQFEGFYVLSTVLFFFSVKFFRYLIVSKMSYFKQLPWNCNFLKFASSACRTWQVVYWFNECICTSIGQNGLLHLNCNDAVHVWPHRIFIEFSAWRQIFICFCMASEACSKYLLEFSAKLIL